ncbi:MAG: phage holin family protein [Thermoanaerobaculia bacterium]
MTNYAATDADRTLGQIIKDLTTDITMLFRSEIALLKLEIRDMFAKVGGGTVLLTIALFLGLFGLAFLFVTITLGLIALGVPAWVSALIVTVVLFAGAGVLAIMGKKKFAAVKFVPTESVEHIKSDIETLKADIARVRSR